MQKPGEHQISAVASRSLERSKKFAQDVGAARAYGSYDEIVQDRDIDVYYVGTINPTHHELCVKLLSAGKSVLCEKPLTLNKKTAEELIKLAKENNVFFMEAFWSKCFPAWQKAKEALAEIGDVKAVTAQLGVPILGVDRVSEASLGGGTLLDLGCYTILFAQHVFGPEPPKKVTCVGQLVKGVDVATTITLEYADNKMANLQTSALVELENNAVAYGTKGIIKLQGKFHCATKLDIRGTSVEYPLPGKEPRMKFDNSEGLFYEQQHVRECLLTGLKESPLVPHAHSLISMDILDQCRQQIGVVYPQEK